MHRTRPRLTRLIEGALDAPLVLVDAPTGYGKTIAVRDFLEARGGTAAVVEIEPADDDPARFWDKLGVAVAAAWPGIVADLADLAESDRAAGAPTTGTAGRMMPGAVPTAGGYVRRLVPLLHERTREDDPPMIVVLDDLHLVHDPSVLADLAYLVDRLPPALRLVATARRTPALPIARWRAQGRVTEITTDNLCFRPDEVADLLGVELRQGEEAMAAELQALSDRSEGWAAGLQLLAASSGARGPLEPDAADELLSAVLADQPAEIEELLLATSQLGRFTADLCRVVTGRPDTGALLHELQAANLFVVPLDDQQDWFRYQRLFGELLRARVERRTVSARDLDRRRTLHRAAAAWFEADGKPADAVAHHVRAGDTERAFALPNAEVDVFARGPQVSGIDWEGLFPTAWLEEDPQRMIWFAALLAPSGGIERMGGWLDRAEAALALVPPDDRRLGLLAAAQTYWHALRNDATRTIERGQQALALLDEPVTSTVMGRRVLISMLIAHLLIDELDGADRLCTQLDAHGVPDLVRSLAVPGFRARLAYRKGQLQQAEGLARLVRRMASSMGMPLHVGVRDANLALAGVLGERGAGDEAALLYDDAVAMAEGRRWLAAAMVTRVERVRLDAAVHGPAVGLEGVGRLRQSVESQLVGPDAVAEVDALEAALLAAAGGPFDRAAQLIAGLRPGRNRRLLEVRLALATGELDRAARLLGGVVGSNLRDRLVVDLLAARLARLTGDHQARDVRLRAAADRARAQGFRRIFLVEAPELVPALHTLADRQSELRPLADEIARLAAGSTHGRAEPLTERELSVLRYLQSQLTHQEIAGQLGISANTLKTHTRALYRKLGASSRAAAIAEAVRAGLL